MSAYEIMRSENPNALIGMDGNVVCMIEDHTDPDWRLYRIEIKSTPDGRHAVGYCLYNPWDDNPYDYLKSHVRSDGFICLGNDAHSVNVQDSPFTVEEAIAKTRFWCTGFSVLMETGDFPDP